VTDVESAPWFVYPPAVDLANTVGPASDDLLDAEGAAEAFARLERGRFPHVEVVAGRTDEARAVRTTVRRLLGTRVDGEPLPAADVATVNRWSAAAPTHPVLTDAGVVHVDRAATGWDGFRAAVARSAIELVSGDDLQRCRAPGCGMFYVRAHPRQTWCSPACGNRARVARHAARARAAGG
jgi:predicted RNA-binding Zn ribbon-like protein